MLHAWRGKNIEHLLWSYFSEVEHFSFLFLGCRDFHGVESRHRKHHYLHGQPCWQGQVLPSLRHMLRVVCLRHTEVHFLVIYCVTITDTTGVWYTRTVFPPDAWREGSRGERAGTREPYCSCSSHSATRRLSPRKSQRSLSWRQEVRAPPTHQLLHSNRL